MPSEQYEQWKRDLFCHLERKLSGCVWCEIGKDRDAHPPTHRGRHGEPSQEIAWTCETMHAHAFDGLRGAGFVEMERYQSAPRSGRCLPDVAILNANRELTAFTEIVRYSRPRNSLRVATEAILAGGGCTSRTAQVCNPPTVTRPVAPRRKSEDDQSDTAWSASVSVASSDAYCAVSEVASITAIKAEIGAKTPE